jgi:clathrin heavy chain
MSDIPFICVNDTHMLFGEACSIFVKFLKPEQTQEKDEQIDLQVLAIGVLWTF